MGNRHWTKKEIDYLEEKAGVWPAEKIAEKLGRSIAATYRKGQNLGLSLKPEIDYLDLQSIARMLDVDHNTVRHWVRLGYLRAGRASESNRTVYRVALKDFKVFYLAHVSRLRALQRADCEGLQWLLEGAAR